MHGLLAMRRTEPTGGAASAKSYHSSTADSLRTIQEVRDLAKVASSGWVTFQEAPGANKAEVLQTLLWNLDVEDGRIASYQYKDPFGLLEMESSGAFIHQWWT